MGIVGVAGSMMLLIAGVGMPISMNYLVDKAYNTDFLYAKRLTVANYNQAAKTYQGQGGQINRAHFSKDDIKNDQNILSVINKSDQEKNAYDFVSSLMSVFLMIIGFALLLVIVVLYNLGSLNFVERMRDYATLQVLGFSKKNLQLITMIENLMSTSIGWILGIPMGICFLRCYVANFSTIRIEYTAYITWQVLLIASALVSVTSAVTTLIISHKIKTINMVETLKGVE